MTHQTRLKLLKYKAIILISFLIGSLSGCMSVEKATSYLEKKEALPQICHDKFPVDTTTRTKTDTLVHFDSLYIPEVYTDTVRQNDTVVITRTNTKYITKYIETIKTVTQKDKAETDALTIQVKQRDRRIIELETTVKIHKEQKGDWVEAFFWALAIIVVLLIYIFRKPIGSVFVKVGSLITKIRNPFK